MEVRDEGKEVKTKHINELEAFPPSELEKDKVFSIDSGLLHSEKTTVMTLI